jgi:hypothetical protein
MGVVHRRKGLVAAAARQLKYRETALNGCRLEDRQSSGSRFHGSIAGWVSPDSLSDPISGVAGAILRETTHVRAMALSFSLVYAHAANAVSGSGPSNLRPWAAHVILDLLAFEKCLGDSSRGVTHLVLKLVKLERLGAAGAWVPVTPTTLDDAALPLQQLRSSGTFPLARPFTMRSTCGPSRSAAPPT